MCCLGAVFWHECSFTRVRLCSTLAFGGCPLFLPLCCLGWRHHPLFPDIGAVSLDVHLDISSLLLLPVYFPVYCPVALGTSGSVLIFLPVPFHSSQLVMPLAARWELFCKVSPFCCVSDTGLSCQLCSCLAVIYVSQLGAVPERSLLVPASRILHLVNSVPELFTCLVKEASVSPFM